MVSFAIIIAAASFGLGIARWLNLPNVPLLLLSGILLGAVSSVESVEELRKALILGLTFLVFVCGMELNPRRIGKQVKTAVLVSIFQFFTIAGLGYLTAWFFGLTLIASMYIALAVAASSTLVVVGVLRQRRLAFEPFGRVVLGVLLIQDLFVVLFISVLSKADAGLTGLILGGFDAIALMVLTWLFQKKIAPYLLLKLRLDEESLLLTVLALLFLFCGIANFLGLPIVVGAFFAGVSLSSFPVNGIIRAQLTSLADFFLAVFFVALGATLSFPASSALFLAGTLILLVLLVTPILVMIIGELSGLSSRSALESGLLLAQTSEFSLIVALIGLQQGHIDNQLLSVIALVTVITMILTPFITLDTVCYNLLKLRTYSQGIKLAKGTMGHIVLIGCGQSGREILKRLREAGERVVVIDNDLATSRRLEAEGITVIRGDGTDSRALRAVKAKQAKLIISTMQRASDNRKLLSFLGKVPMVVSVFEESDAEIIGNNGGFPVLYAKDAAEDFMNWFTDFFSNGKIADMS